MKWLDDIKQQIPMQQIQTLVGQIRTNLAIKHVKKESMNYNLIQVISFPEYNQAIGHDE
jgi:hypothetical protein